MIIKKITEVPRIIYIIFVLIFFWGGGVLKYTIFFFLRNISQGSENELTM